MVERNLFVDESIFESIPLDQLSPFSVNRKRQNAIKDEASNSKSNKSPFVTKTKKPKTKNSKSPKSQKSQESPKSKDSLNDSKNSLFFSEENPNNLNSTPALLLFELIRDEPIPLFRMKWKTKLDFGETFKNVYGKIVGPYYIDFPLNKYDEVLKSLKKFSKSSSSAPKFKIVPIPKFVLESFDRSLFRKETYRKKEIEKLSAKLPCLINSSLHEFQKKSLLFAETNEGRLLIGDEMGLGKTIQSIAICALYKPDWPVLIVAPSSLKENWKFEILKWLPELTSESRIQVVSSFDSGDDELKNKDFFIISYALAVKYNRELKTINYNVIVLDESHMLKSKDAKRSKVIVPLAQSAKRRILLSGTATPSRPIELYTQLQCLKPPGKNEKSWFLTRNAYSIRYCNGHKEMKGRLMIWNDKGNSNLTELYIMLNREVMIRRLKKDALPNLKPKIRKIYRLTKEVAQNPELLSSYSKFDGQSVHKIFNSFLRQAELKEQSEESTSKKPALAFTSETKKRDFMHLYKNTGLAKVKAACLFLKRKTDRDRKTIVFAHHKVVLDAIEDFLLEHEIGYIRIDGKVAIPKRHDLVKQFQRFDYCKVALLSISATGVGITLTAAERVIFAEIDFVPARLLQCEDRAHRIGQTKNVKIYYILANKTLDDFVWPLIQRKLQTISSTLDGCNEMSLKINSSTKFEGSRAIKEKNLDKKLGSHSAKQTQICFGKN